jgi:hypothetical protein
MSKVRPCEANLIAKLEADCPCYARFSLIGRPLECQSRFLGTRRKQLSAIKAGPKAALHGSSWGLLFHVHGQKAEVRLLQEMPVLKHVRRADENRKGETLLEQLLTNLKSDGSNITLP